MRFGGVGVLVVCVMMAPPIVVWGVGCVDGVGGVVGLVGLVCWWCVAWGIAPCGLVCGCWCVGVHVCVLHV